MMDYFSTLLQGLYTSLSLTAASLVVALVLSLVFTLVLTLKTPVLSTIVKGYVTLFTGTPLLVQFFLIYYGPGQFSSLKMIPWLWDALSKPWLCAMLALSLNSAAYTSVLFAGAVRALPAGLWQSCEALGMTKKSAFRLLSPYIFRRAMSSYSNEVILVFKSTSLACTITLMDIMGYGQMLYGRTYDVKVFIAVAVIYLFITGVLTFLMRLGEHRLLAFERGK